MQNKKTYLFIQCLIDALYPEVAIAMLNVLKRLNIYPHYPEKQTCCGQPVFNAGYVPESIIAAKKFIALFEEADHIVAPSGSCVSMVKNHYPQLFAQDKRWRDRAESVAGRIYEFSEFLVDVLGVTNTNASYEGIVTYQDSCHLLRDLGVKTQPRSLISDIAGTRLVEMRDSESCCGFGGAFAFKHPQISTAVLEEKVEAIMETNADVVTGCDMSCLMNIQGMLAYKQSTIRVMHLAQLLDHGT
jgi:L-lactate dehydrogenase complex protein LldE